MLFYIDNTRTYEGDDINGCKSEIFRSKLKG